MNGYTTNWDDFISQAAASSAAAAQPAPDSRFALVSPSVDSVTFQTIQAALAAIDSVNDIAVQQNDHTIEPIAKPLLRRGFVI